MADSLKDLNIIQNLKSEWDVRTDLTNLREGDNRITKDPNAKLFLNVRVKAGRKSLRIVDKNGNEVSGKFSLSMTGVGTAGVTKTCWDCAKDVEGNVHCWKIPCPKLPEVGGGGGGVVR